MNLDGGVELSCLMKRLERMPRQVRRAIELLLASPASKLRLDDLSTRVGVSKYHLSRLFSRYVGEPPCRFQSGLRLVRAEQLLRTGHRPVEVAHCLGYADQSHLCRDFKTRFGVPPLQYLRAHPGDPAADARARR